MLYTIYGFHLNILRNILLLEWSQSPTYFGNLKSVSKAITLRSTLNVYICRYRILLAREPPLDPKIKGTQILIKYVHDIVL